MLVVYLFAPRSSSSRLRMCGRKHVNGTYGLRVWSSLAAAAAVAAVKATYTSFPDRDALG